MSTTSRQQRTLALAKTSETEPRALTPAELAWVALVPWALALLVALVVIGPPLGDLLIRPTSDALWPAGWWAVQGTPEPTEQGRYVLAVLAPALLAVVILVGKRHLPRMRPSAIRAIALSSQILLVALVIIAVLGQHGVILVNNPPLPNQPQSGLFSVPTLIAAAALVSAALIGLRRRPVADWVAQGALETRTRRIVAPAIAAAFAATWLLEAVTTDRLVEDQGQMNWTVNEAFAVLDGRTTLVDYHAIYGRLIVYPAVLVMLLLGKTGFVYTAFMAALSVLVLLAVYAIFRRVTGSSLFALGLFLPFVAVSDVGHTMILLSMWPMRYGAGYLVAWLTVRTIDRARSSPTWIPFFAGGVVIFDSLEFGAAAVLASAVALVCARPPRTAHEALRLAGSALAGIVAAVALVSAFIYARAGTLPDPNVLLEWPRVFSTLGWFSLPVPAVSLHLAVYATFVAAIAVAAVRLARSASDVLLTSMLIWSGIFGLVASSYYIGRSEDIKLLSMFSAWGFALAMLTVVTTRALAARGWRRPTIPELLVLFGLALSICSLRSISLPQREIARLTRATPPLTYRATAERFVGARAERGEKVAILLPESFRIAYDLGLENVSPYGMMNPVVTRQQMQRVIDTVHREGVRRIFVPALNVALAHEGQTAPQQLQRFVDAGYQVRGEADGMLELSSEPAG